MTNFDMPRDGSFDERAGWLVWALARDLNITYIQAAGIVGNLAFESGQFKELQEISPTSGRGGYGWAQWTGPRRIAFESWCAAHDLDPSSDEANYGFLIYELTTPAMQKHSLDRLKETTSVDTATFTFGFHFEKPRGTTPTHLPAMSERLGYAKRALAASVGVMADRTETAETKPMTPATPTETTPANGVANNKLSAGSAGALVGGTTAMLAAVLIWATTWPIKPLDPATALALAGLVIQGIGMLAHVSSIRAQENAPPDAQQKDV